MPAGCGEETTVEACSFISAPTERTVLPRGQERFAWHEKYPTVRSCGASQPWRRAAACSSDGGKRPPLGPDHLQAERRAAAVKGAAATAAAPASRRSASLTERARCWTTEVVLSSTNSVVERRSSLRISHHTGFELGGGPRAPRFARPGDRLRRSKGQEANAIGLPTIHDFFGSRCAEKLASEGKQADLVIANNVVAHVDEIK